MMRIKLFVIALLLLLVAMSIPVSAATQTPKTITIFFQWSAAAKTLEKAVSVFEQRNPGIKVNIVAGSMDNAPGWEKLMVAIAGGNPPDLVTLSGTYYAELQQKGLLEPLNNYISADLKSKFHPSLWNNYTVNGKIYGVPGIEGGPGLGLIYNKEIFASAGIANPKPDAVMTWDEFGAISRKLAKRESDGRLTRVGYYPKEGGSNSLNSVAATFGADWFDYATGRATLDNPVFAQVAQMYKTYFYEPFGYQDVENAVKGRAMWTSQATSLFANRGSATVNIGYYAPGELKLNMPDGDIGVTWVPNNNRQKTQTIGAWALLMFSSAKYKPEVWSFIQFLSSPEATKFFFEDRGWLGGLHKDLPRYIDLANNAGTRWYVDSLSAADVVVGGTVNMYAREAGNLWADVYEQVVSGKGSAEQLLAEANRVLNAKIAQDKAK